ncbi:MAG TPA: hypothetical protein VIO64_05460 [Pseudobacteroides sp.]|uniref:hypothetical protein n=1 Tax=Pseudobacteroides sp. TaxID=1968840 RepID=UPI002F9265CF
MSRGISIYYKLIKEDDLCVLYGYSGVDVNKEYDKDLLLKYDGVIEISKETLIKRDFLDAVNSNGIKVLNECFYEWHHSRVISGEETMGFFAMRVIYKIFKEFKEQGRIPDRGAVVY